MTSVQVNNDRSYANSSMRTLTDGSMRSRLSSQVGTNLSSGQRDDLEAAPKLTAGVAQTIVAHTHGGEHVESL